MSVPLLSEEDIRSLFHNPSIEDGYLILNKLKTRAKNKYQFENELISLFPSAAAGRGKLYKAIERFLISFKNKEHTAKASSFSHQLCQAYIQNLPVGSLGKFYL